MSEAISRRAMLKTVGAAAGAAAALGVNGGLPSAAAAVLRTPTTTAGRDVGLTGRSYPRCDPTYEAARQGWDTLFSSYPSRIVFAQETADVTNSLTWARAHHTACGEFVAVAIRWRAGHRPTAGS